MSIFKEEDLMVNEDGKRLLNEAMEDGKDYLPRLREGISEVALLFQEGREGEAINLFIQCIEGLEWFVTLVSGMATFEVEKVNKEEFFDLSFKAKGVLQELLEAWDNKDTVLIGDLLEFEVVPIIDQVINAIP